MQQPTLLFTNNSATILKFGIYQLTALTFVFLLSFNGFSQVGINTISPTTTLDVEGAISLRESPRPLRVGNGLNTDITLTGDVPYSHYLIEGPTAAFQINGIKTVADADGQIVRLVNNTDYIMTLVHNEGDELKIICPAGKNLVVGGRNSSVTLQYSKGLRKWTVFGYSAPSSSALVRKTVFGTTNIARQNSSWAPMDGLTITFTPVNPVVYIIFNAYGSTGGATADFQLVKNGVYIPNSFVRGTGSNGLYGAALSMFPLKVTPGLEITISAEWYRTGLASQIIRNNAATDSDHGRFLTIIE